MCIIIIIIIIIIIVVIVVVVFNKLTDENRTKIAEAV